MKFYRYLLSLFIFTLILACNGTEIEQNTVSSQKATITDTIYIEKDVKEKTSGVDM